jgi:hypothetical protein
MLSDFQVVLPIRRWRSCWVKKQKLQPSKETVGKRKGNWTFEACNKQPQRYTIMTTECFFRKRDLIYAIYECWPVDHGTAH